MALEQVVHDRINLVRLVRRLEQSIADERWDSQPTSEELQHNSYMTWIKVQGTLQKLKYARSLLKIVELDEDSGNDQVNYESLRETLSRLEDVMKEANERLAPVPSRPTLMLPKMPPSVHVEIADAIATEEPLPTAESTISPTEAAGSPASSLKDLLLSSSDPLILPQATTTLKAADTPARNALESSSVVHEELATQLAQMATQLKRNALHFSENLWKDRGVVEEAQEKLESNYGFMKTERTRLRDHRGRSGGTTCLTLGSLLVVALAFVVMVLIIRMT